MITTSLFGKTFASLAVLFVVTAAAMLASSAWRIDEHLTEQHKSKGTAIATVIGGFSTDLLLFRDTATVQATIDQLLDIHGVSYVFLTDRDGEIVCHTFAPCVPDSVRGLAGDPRDTTVRPVTAGGIGECTDVCAPIVAGEIGYVHVGMDRGTIRSAIHTAVVTRPRSCPAPRSATRWGSWRRRSRTWSSRCRRARPACARRRRRCGAARPTSARSSRTSPTSS
jgi:hypothetical protein